MVSTSRFTPVANGLLYSMIGSSTADATGVDTPIGLQRAHVDGSEPSALAAITSHDAGSSSTTLGPHSPSSSTAATCPKPPIKGPLREKRADLRIRVQDTNPATVSRSSATPLEALPKPEALRRRDDETNSNSTSRDGIWPPTNPRML